MSTKPEINLARRLHDKYNLVPPIDIERLLARYADVEIVTIPFDVDGVCIGLKVPGRRPRVLVNDTAVLTRRRFTMAHELGHVVIPWHIGLIVDQLEGEAGGTDPEYWALEAEANRFASELLMPTSWVLDQISQHEDPGALVYAVARDASVSFTAALIKILDILPPGYTFAKTHEGIVVWAQRSRGTFSAPPVHGSKIDKYDFADQAEQSWAVYRSEGTYRWWRFPKAPEGEFICPDGTWRDLLDEIMSDLGLEKDEDVKFRRSLHGIIAATNGSVRQDRRMASVYDACINRLRAAARDRRAMLEFTQHEKYDAFVRLRVKELVEKH